MGHPLQSIDWRIERADEHLAALDREIDAFLDEEDRRVVGHFEADSSEYVFKFTGEPPNPRLGLIVGEFAHNLRAALDNLVWQLVRLRGGSPTRRTEFPIYVSRKRYRDRGRSALRGVSADDRAAIEAIQPYHAGERAPDTHLAVLAWLNNVDKHRFLHVGGAFANHLDMPVYYGSSKGKPAGFFPWHPIPVQHVAEILDVQYVPTISSDDSTELMRVRIRASGPNPQMKVKGDAPLQVGLSDPQHNLILAHLRSIRNYVVSVIDGLRPRFDI